MSKFQLEILGISEMRWRGSGEFTSTNGNVVLYSGKDDRSESGVAVVISKNSKKTIMSWEPINDRIIVVRFCSQIKKAVTIIQCYAPTEDAEESAKDAFYEQLAATLNKVSLRDVLILSGDFNAKIGSNNSDASKVMGRHGMGTRNDNGERFIGLCQEFNLVIGGSLFPHKDIHKYTWTSPDGQTKNQIDHICIRQRWRTSLMDIRTKRSADMDSDHELIIASIKLKLNKNYNQTKNRKTSKRFALNKLVDERKRNEVATAMRDKLTANYNTWEETCAELNNIAEEAIGFANNDARKIWISDNTWSLIQQRNNLKLQILTDYRLKPQYSAVAKTVKRSARADKRKYFDTLASEAENAAGANNMRQLYKIIGRLSNQNFNHNKAVKDVNGQLLTTTEQQIRRWKEHFEEISHVEDDNEENLGLTDQLSTLIESIDINPPSMSEIITAIIALKRNKAPGDDGIPAEILQTEPTTSAEIIHPFLVEAWQNERLPNDWSKGTIVKLPKKGDLSDCNNWRGITLLNTIYKLMAMIINTRLQCVEQSLRDEQAGFRPHRNCVDQVNTLRIIIDQSVEWRSPLYLVFVDFQKAFDTIRRSAIWTALRNKGVPVKVINVIRAMYDNATIQVRHSGMNSELFTTNAGVKQGCPLSPLLFAVTLDDIMKEISKEKRGIVWGLQNHLEDLDFADDICLISHRHCDMQSKLDELVVRSRAIGLEVNIKKTKAMRIHNTNSNTFKVNDQEIQFVDTFCYLGCMMNVTGGIEEDVRYKLGKARSAFGRLNRIWRSPQLSLQTKIRIFSACVKAPLLYGSETWLTTDTVVRKIQSQINKFLRIICRIFWPNIISNSELWNRTNETPITVQIRKRKWKWIGHTLRKPAESICRAVLEWNPQGSRRRGRPKNTWRRTILMEIRKIDTSWEDIKTYCNDRNRWNTLVQALCSPEE